MKVKVIFDDWKEGERSVYNMKPYLSNGLLHSGTMWGGEINFDADTEAELKEKGKYRAIFEIIPGVE